MMESEAQKLVTVLVTAFPMQFAKLDTEQRKETRAIYRRMLEDLDYPAANAAVERLLATARFLPTIAEIREATVNVKSPARPGVDAWGDVLGLLSFRDRAAMASVDPLVIQVCRTFGWLEWRTLWRRGEDIEQWHVVTSENEASDRARFAELYDKLVAQRRLEQNTAALPAAQRYAKIKEAEQAANARTLVDGLTKSLTEGGDHADR